MRDRERAYVGSRRSARRPQQDLPAFQPAGYAGWADDEWAGRPALADDEWAGQPTLADDEWAGQPAPRANWTDAYDSGQARRPGRRRRGRHARAAVRRMVLPALLICGLAAMVVVIAVIGPGYRAQRSNQQASTTIESAEIQPLPPGRSVDTPVSRAKRPSPAASPAPKATTAPLRERVAPAKPRRVAGLNEAQTAIAQVIVDVGRERGLPRRAVIVAMATAMQESNLRNLANRSVPDSLGRPNDGVAADFDSVGVFQQRASQGWGTVGQLMDTRYAASAFYERLEKVPGWQDMAVTQAAQAVQRSGFPDAYAKHETRAVQIVAGLSAATG